MANLQVLSKANHAKKIAPIKIMQFGEGNFLRAFIDWMIQKMNDSGKYEGHVVVVQPLPFGRVKELAEQDGLYTLILQGLDENGQPVRTHDVIDVLDDFVNPYVDYKKYLDYAESKDLEVIISNTTEAGIAFEQNYSEIDGDSASSTELYALLPAIGEIPIRQDVAVTGSVNQLGMIQPVGGINEKIEGFYHTCKLTGLTGHQAVIIPKSNMKNLILPYEVLDAIRDGKFHIYPVTTIDEGMEILTGRRMGQRSPKGTFPQDSFNAQVEEKLRRMYQATQNK